MGSPGAAGHDRWRCPGDPTAPVSKPFRQSGRRVSTVLMAPVMDRVDSDPALPAEAVKR